jgi:hypothetical protein
MHDSGTCSLLRAWGNAVKIVYKHARAAASLVIMPGSVKFISFLKKYLDSETVEHIIDKFNIHNYEDLLEISDEQIDEMNACLEISYSEVRMLKHIVNHFKTNPP